MFEIISDDSWREGERGYNSWITSISVFLMIKDMEEKFEDEVWRERTGVQ